MSRGAREGIYLPLSQSERHCNKSALSCSDLTWDEEKEEEGHKNYQTADRTPGGRSRPPHVCIAWRYPHSRPCLIFRLIYYESHLCYFLHRTAHK